MSQQPELITDIPKIIFDAVSEKYGQKGESTVTLVDRDPDGTIYKVRRLPRKNRYIAERDADMSIVLITRDDQWRANSRVELLWFVPRATERWDSPLVRIQTWCDLQSERSRKGLGQGSELESHLTGPVSLLGNDTSVQIMLFMIAKGAQLARPFPPAPFSPT